MPVAADVLDSRGWWSRHRFTYNVWLIGAGIVAFICYASIGWTRCATDPDFEITGFTTAFQAAGYLVAIAVANVCYFLGPLSERLIRPQNIELYRRATFALGVAFSVTLPFLIPVTLYFTC